MKRRMRTDIVIRAEHTGPESGSSSNTKHDGRKKQQQQINGDCTARRSMRPVKGSVWFKVTVQQKQNCPDTTGGPWTQLHCHLKDAFVCFHLLLFCQEICVSNWTFLCRQHTAQVLFLLLSVIGWIYHVPHKKLQPHLLVKTVCSGSRVGQMATSGFFVEHVQINDQNLLYHSDLCMPEFPLHGNFLFLPGIFISLQSWRIEIR